LPTRLAVQASEAQGLNEQSVARFRIGRAQLFLHQGFISESTESLFTSVREFALEKLDGRNLVTALCLPNFPVSTGSQTTFKHPSVHDLALRPIPFHRFSPLKFALTTGNTILTKRWSFVTLATLRLANSNAGDTRANAVQFWLANHVSLLACFVLLLFPGVSFVLN